MEWEREMARKFREGKTEGELLKAIEDAVLIVKKYKASPKTAAADVGAPLDKVLEALQKTKQLKGEAHGVIKTWKLRLFVIR